MHERFLPRATEKRKNYRSIMVYVISMEKPEPRNGLTLTIYSLRNSLNKNYSKTIWLMKSRNYDVSDIPRNILNKFREPNMEPPCWCTSAVHLAPVVQILENAIHRINRYSLDSVVCLLNIYLLDSDLSGG